MPTHDNNQAFRSILFLTLSRSYPTRTSLTISLTLQPQLDKSKHIGMLQPQNVIDEEDRIVIEYFDKEKLFFFLFTENELKSKDGILQRFIDPYGEF